MMTDAVNEIKQTPNPKPQTPNPKPQMKVKRPLFLKDHSSS